LFVKAENQSGISWHCPRYGAIIGCNNVAFAGIRLVRAFWTCVRLAGVGKGRGMAGTGSAGGKRVRLVDIAKEVGVSRGAVGRVLLGTGSNIGVSEETAERIRRAAERLDYRPDHIARQLSGVGSKLVGTLLGRRLFESCMRRLAALEAEARRRGYGVIVGQCDYEPKAVRDCLADFDSRHVEVVFYLDTYDLIGRELPKAPRLISCIRLPGADNCYVEADRALGSRLAVEHLLSRGKRRIGLAAKSLAHGEARAEGEKRRGFLEALAERGQADAAGRVVVIDTVPDAIPEEQQDLIDRIVEELVGREKCDAILVTQDRWAVEVLKAVKRRGLSVPRDVAVMGFENREVCTAVEPRLSCLDHQYEAAAHAMMDMAQKLMEKAPIPKLSRGVLIPPRVVAREST
jgi:DNA-binding LacI/PurR family transcriptional regulator